jgi:ATP-binding cassette subfamily B (MDR/TAP) protein 1
MQAEAKEDGPKVQKEDALFDLGDSERKIIEEQLELPTVNATYRSLYRYAEGRDILIMSVSSVCAIAAGAVLPLMTVRITPLGAS